MAFSKKFRYRNLGGRNSEFRKDRPPSLLPIGIIGAVLVVCFGCLGVVIGWQVNSKLIPNSAATFNPLASEPKATATPNLKAPIPLKTQALNESGLELTVTAFQRPLPVQGLTQLPPDQQFVLASVQVRNPKTSGAAIKISPADFKLKGDGGLAYDANPKTVTIENLMTPQDQVAPGKVMDRELIFQVAKNDAGLRLYWTAGKTTRVFVLEPEP